MAGYIDTPWLRDQSRDFTGEGVRTGAVIGEMFLRSVAQKQEMQQKAQEFPLRLKGLQLQNEAQQNAIAQGALTLEANRQSLPYVTAVKISESKNALQNMEAQADWADTVAGIGDQLGTPTADTLLHGFLQRHPSAATAKWFNDWVDQNEVAKWRKDQLDSRLRAEEIAASSRLAVAQIRSNANTAESSGALVREDIPGTDYISLRNPNGKGVHIVKKSDQEGDFTPAVKAKLDSITRQITGYDSQLARLRPLATYDENARSVVDEITSARQALIQQQDEIFNSLKNHTAPVGAGTGALPSTPAPTEIPPGVTVRRRQ